MTFVPHPLRRARRGRRTLCKSALSIVFGCGAFASAQAPNTEYAVKAAFLYHFAQLTNWPAQTFQRPGDPFTFCTIGRDPFDGALESVIAGKAIQSHPVKVMHLKPGGPVKSCQVLFIGSQEEPHASALLSGLAAVPVLTAGEADDFLQQGGMIGLRCEKDRMRFDVNLAPAQKSNLSFSSTLLSLAKSVYPAR